MPGIVSYGAYLPYWRLQRGAIGQTLGSGGGKGARSVASYDEDSTSMGVESGRIAGYVAAHSIEYFGIVHSSLRTRRDDAPVARAARTVGRRAALYAAYGGAIVAVVWLTASPSDGQL